MFSFLLHSIACPVSNRAKTPPQINNTSPPQGIQRTFTLLAKSIERTGRVRFLSYTIGFSGGFLKKLEAYKKIKGDAGIGTPRSIGLS
jgi:hypothetical protein